MLRHTTYATFLNTVKQTDGVFLSFEQVHRFYFMNVYVVSLFILNLEPVGGVQFRIAVLRPPTIRLQWLSCINLASLPISMNYSNNYTIRDKLYGETWIIQCSCHERALPVYLDNANRIPKWIIHSVGNLLACDIL